MKSKKMNLASIQGKLSRVEMKSIMAGSNDPMICGWPSVWFCSYEGQSCSTGGGYCYYCDTDFKWVCNHG